MNAAEPEQEEVKEVEVQMGPIMPERKARKKLSFCTIHLLNDDVVVAVCTNNKRTACAFQLMKARGIDCVFLLVFVRLYIEELFQKTKL